MFNTIITFKKYAIGDNDTLNIATENKVTVESMKEFVCIHEIIEKKHILRIMFKSCDMLYIEANKEIGGYC